MRYCAIVGSSVFKSIASYVTEHSWWYRTLVDAKVYECKKACGEDTEAMKKYIAEHWGIRL